PTPIGNLEDMTFRAVRVLQEADLIAAEDTRTTGVLLKHYGIETPQTALHQHNEHKRVPDLIAQLGDGRLSHLAVVTDAGTPGISDPGFLLVRAAVQAGIRVEALPGATAFVPALVSSGFPCDRFVFEGFLPLKKGRKTRLEALAAEPRTLVFYESPHRLQRTLQDFLATFGPDRSVCVCRELTKRFEELVRGTLPEVMNHFGDGKVKGELVLVVAGAV
ncbi:MAG: 16S rRNA (cytidine(1402)-2'-O)-methyltransferase, partial [Bacteroidetes bacterium]